MPGLLGWNTDAVRGLLNDFTTGISRLPYRSVGAPVDLATTLLRPMGYDVEKPVMGSDWLIDQGVKAGIARAPTGTAAETAGDVIGGLLDPNPGPEAALAAKAAGLLGDPSTQGLLHAIFAGPMAKTADHNALQRAHAMITEGADDAKIWRETGWWVNTPDGVPRSRTRKIGAPYAHASPLAESGSAAARSSPEHTITWSMFLHKGNVCSAIATAVS